jgi:CRISPR-associated protein Cmx8
MSKISVKDEKIILEYNLFDLPTAQHKAGLAGLAVMIKSLEIRKMSPLPEITLSPTTARITFTKESLQTVFNDLYDAEWIEVESNQKWQKQEPKRIEEREVKVNGKKKKVKKFIYDAVEPKGAFLQTFYPDGDGLWIKLWRNMLWNILRGIPATRNVYTERANQITSSETEKNWKALLKTHKEQKKGKIITESLSSSLFIGAEAENFEKVPFKGTVQDNFLLNFWLLVSLIYVPRELKIERSEDQLRVLRNKELGYVLTIPEPYDLENFTEEVIEVLQSLETKKSGFRPLQAVIDLFEEGGLEYLYHFARKKIDDFNLCVCAIETYHLEKQGNRIRQLAADRISPDFQMIKDYGEVREAFRNPFYKRIYLRNLLNGRAWYVSADEVFHHNPMPIFVQSIKTPKEIRFFGKDVSEKFRGIEKTLEIEKGAKQMTEKDYDEQLALRVYRLIQNYIRRRTEEKSGKKYNDFKNIKNEKKQVIYPKEYREALEKVSSDAFLAMRGRREQDFIEYFTGTICSVPQFLPEAEYMSVAMDLTENWQKVKTLSMLAVSANSYVSETSGKKEDK